MKRYYSDPRTVVYWGDCAKVLPGLKRNWFDACFCDPPYGISFMSKGWDHGIPSSTIWAAVLRVLKPGAPLLSFGGTRTYHRLVCAIEDAGFEVRDCLMWLYGSWFPKSLDISKMVDKGAGAEREVIGNRRVAIDRWTAEGRKRTEFGEIGSYSIATTVAATPTAKLWSGYGTALKPAWEPIVLAMKPCEGTFAENALRWGVAGLNVDGCRIPLDTLAKLALGKSKQRTNKPSGKGLYHDDPEHRNKRIKLEKPIDTFKTAGRWPANLLFGCACDGEHESGCPVRMLDKRGGVMLSRGGSRGKGGVWGQLPASPDFKLGFGDVGGVSRFFYTAKVSPSERSGGGFYRGTHPTAKPVDLCRWLAALSLPPKSSKPRRLLVPFSGSGSEILGALDAGWDMVVGIEIEEAYCKLAAKRLGRTRGGWFYEGKENKT